MSATVVRVSSRDVALAVARDVFGPQQRGAQAAFDYRSRRAGLGPRDRAFAAELAYGAIKMRRALDWYLRPYLEKRSQPVPAPIAEALRIGVYQLRFMSGVEPHAAVFETVNSALRVGHRGTAGLVNAILRRMLAEAPAAPSRDQFVDEDDFLGTRYSVPTWLVARWRERLGDRVEAALAGIDAAPQLAIRVNTLRASTEEVAAELTERGIVLRPSAFVREVQVIEGRPEIALRDDEAGKWALQGESACIPVDLADPQPGERIVDLCSGRGNKAVQIAARLRGEGTLTCVELDERKADVLEQRLASAGASNAAVIRGDATLLSERADADAVLVDAPCSGDGVLGRHPEARWRKTPDDGPRLAPTQSALLAAGASHTKPGGRLVYAVCTIDPRECEDVVEEFLRAHPEFARFGVPERYEELATGAGDVVVAPGIDGRDGFFIATLRRSP